MALACTRDVAGSSARAPYAAAKALADPDRSRHFPPGNGPCLYPRRRGFVCSRPLRCR